MVCADACMANGLGAHGLPRGPSPRADQPSIWAIGDIQGCSKALHRLLAHPDIASDAHARFWIAGDLVNRGPDSLGVLRKVMALGDRAISILGNHDLHLLAVAAGVRKRARTDTLDDVLQAPDAAYLLDWLRHRPLAHYAHGHLMVHAGVASAWDVPTTLSLAEHVSCTLRNQHWKKHIGTFFGNQPDRWRKTLSAEERLRFTVNALTRMRLCTPKGRLDFAHKDSTGAVDGLIPWFDVVPRKSANVTVVFGHWSALGLLLRPNVIALDTGCVWGGKLTAVRLHDRKVVQVDHC